MLLMLLGSCLAGAAQPPARVGTGDVRQGYESVDYQTDTRAVDTRLGARLPLAEMAGRALLGLPMLESTLSPPEVDLGRQLFFDRRLSSNDTLSCAMCHIPEQGFTQNEMATPVGMEGRSVRRNAPSLYNVAFVENLFLDGRENSLIEQIWSPLLAHNEMANANRAVVIARLRSVAAYREKFRQLYAQGLTAETLGKALAAYQSALRSAASPFDHWYFGANETLRPDYPQAARLGFEVFKAAGCSACHTLHKDHALFTDGLFHNTGTGFLRAQRAAQPARVQLAPGVFVTPAVQLETQNMSDDGRAEVTADPFDRWRYRTPSLRNVALTSPYMHDGSIPTLNAVVQFYNAGGGGDPRQDPRIRPLNLTAAESESLVAFLSSLTGDNVDALAADARSVAVG